MKPKTIEDWDFILSLIDAFFLAAKTWDKQKLQNLLTTLEG